LAHSVVVSPTRRIAVSFFPAIPLDAVRSRSMPLDAARSRSIPLDASLSGLPFSSDF
jgi:hypothetical protein